MWRQGCEHVLGWSCTFGWSHHHCGTCCAYSRCVGLDSLDTVEVVMAIEEEFTIEIPDDQAEKLLSISDAVEFIAAHPQAK